MNSLEIKNILRNPYNREDWKNLYRNIFQGKVTFFDEPYQYEIKEEIVESLLQIGYVTLDDEYIVALFEVNIKSNVNVLSKKIGLRKIISKYISEDKFNGVLTIFENGSDDYRFTFASKTTTVTEDGVYISETSSKRFTYILGKNEPCVTPSQRFENLLNKNGSINIDDVVDAFSVEKLNKEFFNGYKEHYELLCNFFYGIKNKKKVFQDDEKLIRDYVKKFLGRIVFLYFVQKKGWLGVKEGAEWGTGDHQFLSNQFKSFSDKSHFYSKVISKIFFDFLSFERKNDLVELEGGISTRIPYLNGGLFEKESIDENEIDFNESDLCSLFDFFDKFNFTIYEDDPNEQTVAVDPEMLGHIFENLLEDNKDKGAFYTPKEIVHYMCQESLIEYLTTWFENKGYEIIEHSKFENSNEQLLFPENESRLGQLKLETPNKIKKIGRKLIEDLLKKRLTDNDKSIVIEHFKEFNDALDNVKICDPAIGSGAFPMGLLQEIYVTKQLLWNFEFGNLENFPSSEIKLNIIQNSIYGVDIEKGAVDIARLRFWLSLIVDEKEPKSLPNLEFKIVVGNSLFSILENEIVEIDWKLKFNNLEKVKNIILDQQNKLYQLEHFQHLYFLSYTDKTNIKKNIKFLKIEILQNQLSLTKINFLEKNPIVGGFIPSEYDIQINEKNKRHIEKIERIIENLNEIKKDEHKDLDYFDWRLNFPEIFNSKINQNPGFSILIGNPPYISYYSRQAVKIDESHLEHIKSKMDFILNKSKKGRFHSVQFFLEKQKKLLNDLGILYNIIDLSFFENTFDEIRGYLVNNTKIFEIVTDLNVFENVTSGQLIIGFQNNKRNIDSNLVKWKFNINDRLIKVNQSNWNKPPSFKFSLPENSLLSKIESNSVEFQSICDIKTGVNIGGVKSYFLKNDSKYYKFINGSNNVQKYQIIYPSTKQIKDGLMYFDFNKKVEKEIWDSNIGTPSIGESNRRFLLPKIVIRQSDTTLTASYDDSGYHCDYNLFTANLLEKSDFELKYILSILNSKLMSFYVIQKGYLNIKPGKTPQIRVSDIKILPIKFYEFQSKIVEIVDKIILNKMDNLDTTSLENKLDILIYKIYNLSFEEVKIIDSNFELKKDEYLMS